MISFRHADLLDSFKPVVHVVTFDFHLDLADNRKYMFLYSEPRTKISSELHQSLTPSDMFNLHFVDHEFDASKLFGRTTDGFSGGEWAEVHRILDYFWDKLKSLGCETGITEDTTYKFKDGSSRYIISYRITEPHKSVKADLIDSIKKQRIKTTGILQLKGGFGGGNDARWAVAIELIPSTGSSPATSTYFWLGNLADVPKEELYPGNEINVGVDPQDQFAYYRP